MNVKEASEVCKNRDLWHSVLSAHPDGNLA